MSDRIDDRHRLATLRFLGCLIATNLRASIALRGAFWIQAATMAVNNLIFLCFWWIFFDRFESVRGWQAADVVALFGIVAVGFGCAVVFTGGIRDLAMQIVDGDLDAYLVQPKPPLALAIASRSSATGWGDIVSGIFLIALSGHVGLAELPLAVLAALLSASVFVATGVLFQSAAFWLGRVHALARQLWEFQVLFSTYPTPIFGGGLRLLLYTLVPAGFIGHLPVALVRDFSWAALAASVAGACFFVGLAAWVFATGLRRYESGNRFGVRL